jgi:hypothetical protein
VERILILCSVGSKSLDFESISNMSPPLLALPLELRQQIFSSLALTPHTVTISLSNLKDCQSSIEKLSKTCKQLRHEIGAWASSNSISHIFLVPPFGIITSQTSIQFQLSSTQRHSPIRVSKTPQNIAEAAVFWLWRDIMQKLNTCRMDVIDREIRDRFDRGDERILSVLEEVYDEFMEGRGRGTVEDVMIYGGNRYWVISTNFWGLNVCGWEGRG